MLVSGLRFRNVSTLACRFGLGSGEGVSRDASAADAFTAAAGGGVDGDLYDERGVVVAAHFLTPTQLLCVAPPLWGAPYATRRAARETAIGEADEMHALAVEVR